MAGPSAPVTTLAQLEQLLLENRGVTDAEAFYTPNYQRDIHDPFLLFQMDVAVNRIYQAIADEQHIMVYGDYDADGVTSTAIITSVLQRLGAHVTPFLPHRSEHGYGLHSGVVRELANDIGLVITVDCGISNVEQIADLAEDGVDTIVVDHHLVPKVLPAAVAIIHPAHPQGSYPWRELCGAGTAWKLAQGLLRDQRSGVADDPDQEKWLLDLAALGTVADMVPLLGENRAIVQFGLEVLRRSPRPGIHALLAAGRLDVAALTAKDLSWRVIPLLNAAGRMDHAQPALDVLSAQTPAEAERAMAEIKELDTLRRSKSKEVADAAALQINPDAAILFAHHVSWPAGVVGLAANALVRQFARPALVAGGNGEALTGSVRTTQAVNAVEMLTAVSHTLVKFGGHARAAGFTVALDQVENFTAALVVYGESLAVAAPVQLEQAEVVLAADLVTTGTVHLLQKFAPFGQGNTEPTFVIKDLILLDWRPVGKSGDHAKLNFKVGDHLLEAIGFGLAKQLQSKRLIGQTVDVLAQLSENEWRGRRTLQLSVEALVPAGTVRILSQHEEQLASSKY